MWYCWPRLTVSICECYRGISPTLSSIPLLHCCTNRPMWTNGSLLQLVSLKWWLETSFQHHPSEQVLWVYKESGMGQSSKGREGGRWERWLRGGGEVEEENCAGGACNNFVTVLFQVLATSGCKSKKRTIQSNCRRIWNLLTDWLTPLMLLQPEVARSYKNAVRCVTAFPLASFTMWRVLPWKLKISHIVPMYLLCNAAVYFIEPNVLATT